MSVNSLHDEHNFTHSQTNTIVSDIELHTACLQLTLSIPVCYLGYQTFVYHPIQQLYTLFCILLLVFEVKQWIQWKF